MLDPEQCLGWSGLDRSVLPLGRRHEAATGKPPRSRHRHPRDGDPFGHKCR